VGDLPVTTRSTRVKGKKIMGQILPLYSAEEFVLDILKEGGPEMLADVAIKCIALAIASGALEINALVKFALAVQRHDELIVGHFLEAGTRSGSFRLPDA
jgi:hypothetical protein